MAFLLETDRLRLREMTADDLDFVASMLGDPDVMRHYPKVFDRNESAAWLARQRERYARDGSGLWLVELRDTSEPIGQIGLAWQEVDGEREPEIGWLLHRPYWKRGYATEAALGVRRWAFGVKNLPYVISLIRPVNLASAAVARRLGMVPVRETQFHGYLHRVFAVRREDVGQS